MDTLGAELLEADAGVVAIRLPFDPRHSQQDGYVHAGVISTIADSACGYAALTLLPESKEVLSIEFKINLLAPAKGEAFVARAEVVKQGRTISVCRADVDALNGDSMTPIAAMTATIFAVDKRSEE
ncbi:MAG: PaaI family thioesterase [Phycisphaerales bacterium]